MTRADPAVGGTRELVSLKKTANAAAVIPIHPADSVATITIAGRSVLEHTVMALQAVEAIGPIVFALEGDGLDRAMSAYKRTARALGVTVAGPLPSRWLAMQAALRHMTDVDRVIVQEPDRPLASATGLTQLLAGTWHHPVVVTALPVHSSIKRVVDGRIVASVPRDALHAAESPWIFDRQVLEDYLRSALALGVPPTHELELLRHSDLPVHLAAGELYNVRVASAADARFAELALEHRFVRGFGARAALASLQT